MRTRLQLTCMWARTYTDLLGNYFVDKHHLIHLNASPPMLDERLAKWVEKVLPIGVCIHSVFVALSYTGDARSHHKTSTWPFRAWWSA